MFLQQGGPYKFVRHPAYAGYILAILSLFLTTGVLWLLAVLIVLPFFIYQARDEEKIFREMFGSVYREYASKTGMFFAESQAGKCGLEKIPVARGGDVASHSVETAESGANEPGMTGYFCG
ncbi:MAG: isoprenylcysteine carboxylmethyltransferase family protein [Deltaproteobacteria bacterium]|uniref:methyltransferase family protein n=1 Tax=Desulfobacula sp. TaxID=2593537 RepID=UPI00198A7E33|nr:isoprenylcysteine carboxylmethyltransferase family protein [Candidatus Desulfobacula maris]MBL6994405.1 isoprenylcysteine carboxylmethyltransferase family protein [Desulfobacula sp.]